MRERKKLSIFANQKSFETLSLGEKKKYSSANINHFDGECKNSSNLQRYNRYSNNYGEKNETGDLF